MLFPGRTQRLREGRLLMTASGRSPDHNIRATLPIVDILVGTSGEVVCAKSLIRHPIIRGPVETALRSWQFKPAELEGKPVAYLGRLEFTLCNISCGKEGPSMTLLK